MDTPQSADEVQPVVAALQRIDPRLDVRWNATAILTKRGSYGADGTLRAPEYDGRWEVVCYESGAQTATWRPYQRVCLVTQPDPNAARGVPTLLHHGPYAPLGPWLVDFMHAIDQAKTANMLAMSRKIDADLAAQEASAQSTEDEGTVDVLDRMWDDAHREAGVAVFHPVRVDLVPSPL